MASQPDIGSDPTHILPFHSLKEKEACTEGDDGGDPTEPDYQLNRFPTARPVRATPANIIPPSRLWAGGFEASRVIVG